MLLSSQAEDGYFPLVIMLIAGTLLFVIAEALSEPREVARLRHVQNLEKIVGGERTLRQVKYMNDVKSEWSGSGLFYLIAGDGSATGSTKQKTKILFSWEIGEGRYTFSEVPLSKVSTQTDPDIETPTVSFEIDKNKVSAKHVKVYSWREANEIIDNMVSSIIIRCREEQWKESIKMTPTFK